MNTRCICPNLCTLARSPLNPGKSNQPPPPRRQEVPLYLSLSLPPLILLPLRSSSILRRTYHFGAFYYMTAHTPGYASKFLREKVARQGYGIFRVLVKKKRAECLRINDESGSGYPCGVLILREREMQKGRMRGRFIEIGGERIVICILD